MADFLTKRERSARMAAIKAEGTKPERLLVEALRRLGHRPATNIKRIPGNPDIVFRRDRLACFVDGDLWHGGQWRRRGLNCLDLKQAKVLGVFWVVFGGGSGRTPTAAAGGGQVRQSKVAFASINLSFCSWAQRAAVDRSIRTPTSM
jgi:DNA mismatch endonuclease Vsr